MSDITNRIAELPAEKRQLLERYLKSAGVNLSRAVIARQSRERDSFPLSFAQQRLWFLHQLDPASPVYNLPDSRHFKGTLDTAALERSLTEIVRRHEILRTTFQTNDGQPVQVISPPRPVQLEVIDLTALPKDLREQEAQRLADEEAQRPFDLTLDRLLRLRLLRLDADEHVLLVTMHHIISDGWSMSVFMNELTSLYDAFCTGKESPLAELPVQYADYAVWQREWLQGEVLEEQLAYWRRELGGQLPVLELPTDRPRPSMFGFRGSWQSLTLPVELVERLKQLSRESGATLFMTLLSAFDILLSRYTNQTDILVGTPIANRTRAETEDLIGFFVNTLVLRTRVEADKSYREVLEQVREATLGGYAHQDVPFEKLVEELQPERRTSHTPLFQVMFVMQNMPGESQSLEGLNVEKFDAETGTTKFDLTLFTQEMDDGLFCWFQYNTDIYDAATIRRMLRHFHTLLESVAANPDARISELTLLSQEERRQLLFEWNDTESVYPRDSCIHQLFEQQAERTPNAVALCFADEQLTYSELNRRANQLAHRLLALGVLPDTAVGVLVPRCAQMVVSWLAILKAGAAYLPLDLDYPAPRLRFMLRDAAVRVLITDSSQLDALSPDNLDPNLQVLSFDVEHESLSTEPTGNPPHTTTADSLAYVIYTSGSTGQPKGVSVTHRGVVRLVCETNYISLSSIDRVAQVSNASFDAATFEVWGALLHGARLVGLSTQTVLSPQQLAGEIRERDISVMFLTTALFNQATREMGSAFSGLRYLLFGGEAADVQSVRKVLEGGKPEHLLNGYGPTENTTFSTCYEVEELREDAKTVAIGRPIGNTQTFILDTQMQPVPVGVTGELYLGGDGLARGYLNRPELTAERFVPDAYGARAGARLYRTGDMVRWSTDGQIEYVGRVDEQVKVRGYRIELGEIETVMREHGGVRECVVLAREDGARGGDRRLVAYVVPGEKGVRAGELRGFLRERLPEYMLPSVFVSIESLPLTPNGKVDRKALPAPEKRGSGDEAEGFVAPQTPVEEIVAGVWAEVLGVSRVSAEDNFFSLGGHSLLATQITSRVREAFRIELPLRSLFERPTLRQLADAIETQLKAGHGACAPPLVRVARGQALPLSFAQQRLWFIDQFEPGSSLYNIPSAVRLSGRLDLAALSNALTEIVRRHEALRTTFAVEEGEPVQVIHAPQPFDLPLFDLSQLPPDEREGMAERLATEDAGRGFDLSADSLLRARVLRLADDEHILLLNMHHIISDGWSLSVFVREVASLYEAYAGGRESSLEELPVQYADYALWQREWLQGEVLEEQLTYWRRELAGAPAALELPCDRPRPKEQGHRGDHFEFVLDGAVSDGLRELSRREGVTLFMLLLAAWQVLLARHSGQTDISVGTPIAGRTRAETEDLIGFFVNTLVLRADLSGNPTFRELLGQVREKALGAYAHQDVPFEKLVEELQPERDMSHTPLFQVMLVLQNAPEGELELPGLQVSDAGVEDKSSKFDLTLMLQEWAGELHARLTYNVDLFDASTIERMAGHFGRLLRGIIAEPDACISRLPLLSEVERRQLLTEWNETGRAHDPSLALHQLFERQAERTPDAVALRFGREQLTYAELNRRANQLAHHLVSLGVGAESLVGVLSERSAQMVVALVAVLKAGGAYVPLDPQYPQERVAFMLEDAGVSVLLSQQRYVERLPASRPYVLRLDADWEQVSRESVENPRRFVAPEQTAYVIYTSGSTGVPKGVAIEHKSVVAFLAWALDTFDRDVLSGVLASTSICFDLSVFELFAPLACGGTVLLAENALHLPSMHAADEVTLVNTVPSAMAELVRMRAVPPSVRVVNLAGEALQNQLAQSIYEQETVERVYNLYGPSEDTTYSTYAPVERGAERQPTIGRPISNTQSYILDTQLQPVPVGVTGELYLGGDGLARGYLNRPEMTAERFVPDPYGEQAGGRLYRTGDLARYLGDGQIEYQGRIDQQVKVRGYRIELGEIEARLREHEALEAAVAVAREDVPGEKRVVAYVVPTTEAAQGFSHAGLRGYLRERLPDYMIPTAFVTLDALPLTPNGKVNRRALPPPEKNAAQASAEGAAFVAPRTELEEMLADIWGEVLGVSPVGVESNFFDLGGHSLLATRVVSKLRERCGVELPLRVLFESPTVAGVARYVETSAPKENEMGRIAEMLERLESISEDEVRALLESTESEHKA